MCRKARGTAYQRLGTTDHQVREPAEDGLLELLPGHAAVLAHEERGSEPAARGRHDFAKVRINGFTYKRAVVRNKRYQRGLNRYWRSHKNQKDRLGTAFPGQPDLAACGCESNVT